MKLPIRLPSLPTPERLFPRGDRKRFLPHLLIGVPMILAAIYLFGIAADRYVTEAKVMVKRAGGAEGGAPDLGALLAGSYSLAREDALYLKEYILSPDMLARLDRSLDLRRAFGEAGPDIFHRLAADAPEEQFLDYYRARVEVSFDDKTSLLTVRTEGFTPVFAQRFNQAILAEAESFINDISHKIAREQMDFAGHEVERSRHRLDAARDALLAHQNLHGVLDPVAQAEAAGKLVADLEARRAQFEAELRQLKSYLNADTPQVVTMQNAIRALEAQAAQEKSKLAAPGAPKLNRVAAQFLEAKATVEFNTDLYKLSLTALENTRIEAARKIKNLVVVSSPHLPEEAERPRRALILASLLLVSSLLYGLVRLAWAVIEDHRE